MKNLFLICFTVITGFASAQSDCKSAYQLSADCAGRKDSAVEYLKIYFKLIPELEARVAPFKEKFEQAVLGRDSLAAEELRLQRKLDTIAKQVKAGEKITEKVQKQYFAQKRSVSKELAKAEEEIDRAEQDISAMDDRIDGFKLIAASFLKALIPNYVKTREGLCSDAMFMLNGEIIYLNSQLP